MVFASSFLAAAIAAATPSAIGMPAHRSGRLPDTARPLSYEVWLRPDLQHRTFRGTETIRIAVDRPTPVLVLHANELSISGATLDGRWKARSVKIDAHEQTLTLTFPTAIARGRHALRLEFAGTISTLARGLHVQPYNDNGRRKEMLVTEFEPTDARRVFPLWDEPALRATFALGVDLPPRFLGISNMPESKRQPLAGGWTRFAFQPTPSMSSYLLVLCAGEFETIGARVAGVDVRVVTTRGKAAEGHFALEAATKLLPYYNAYFGVPYPLPKLDLIAHPGGFRGAMENWGGITFHEARLLNDPRRSSTEDAEDTFSIVAHEIAHQWFGNLVTMAWWDDLWLNEGFASWMETKATDHFHPEWRPWLGSSASRGRAMAADARPTTHAIQQPIVNASDAEAAFDDITYRKGEAFIRMLEGYLGETAFRAGIRRYMATHAYGNTQTTDLWTALTAASGQPVGRIAPPWTERPGFPLVTVEAPCEGESARLVLSQARFSADGTAIPGKPWPVPLVYEVNGRPATVLFDALKQEVPGVACDALVKLNRGDVGYYRVQYAPPLFAKRREEFARSAIADQAGLLADTWALAQARRVPATDFLALAGGLAADADPAVWSVVLGAIDTLRELEADRPGRVPFEIAARRLLTGPVKHLGWDPRPGETPAIAKLRPDLLATLGRLRDPAVLAESRIRFTRFLRKSDSLAGDLRPVVFELIGRAGGSSGFDALLALARKTSRSDERERSYRAIALASDPVLARRALALTLGTEVDPTLAIGMLRQASSEHPVLTRTFLRTHRKALLAGRPPFEAADAYIDSYRGFHDNAAADELEREARATLPAETWPEIHRAAARLRFEDGVRQHVLPAIDRWASEQKK